MTRFLSLFSLRLRLGVFYAIGGFVAWLQASKGILLDVASIGADFGLIHGACWCMPVLMCFLMRVPVKSWLSSSEVLLILLVYHDNKTFLEAPRFEEACSQSCRMQKRGDMLILL